MDAAWPRHNAYERSKERERTNEGTPSTPCLAGRYAREGQHYWMAELPGAPGTQAPPERTEQSSRAFTSPWRPQTASNSFA